MSSRDRWEAILAKAGYSSTKALEQDLGIAPAQVWRWVKRGREPRLDSARMVSQALGVTLDEFDYLICQMRSES